MIIRVINSVTDTAVLCLFLLLLAFGSYAVWDTHSVQIQAEGERFKQYRPTEEDARTFEDFRKENPEVFGWLTVYGTNIDYPLVQADDNEKYLNTAADGTHSLSGSLFLDYSNKNDLSDFNSIIYGHHMEGDVMFGEIGYFKDKEYFENRPYGSLYCGGKYYGLEFFAFLETDAYDTGIYHIAVTEEEKERYLDLLRSKALQYRDIGVGTQDRIVLLSTCTSDITNGRHVLAGRLTQSPEEDPFADSEYRGEGLDGGGLVQSLTLPAVIILAIVALILVIIFLKKRRSK